MPCGNKSRPARKTGEEEKKKRPCIAKVLQWEGITCNESRLRLVMQSRKEFSTLNRFESIRSEENWDNIFFFYCFDVVSLHFDDEIHT